MDTQDYIQRAHSALREGELDLAEQYLTLILQISPDHPAALEGLKQVRVARARKGWNRPLQILVEAWGRLLMSLGRCRAAVGPLELLHRSNPGRFSAALAYARCCDRLGHRSEALEAYRVVISLRPEHIPSLRRATDLATEEDHLDEAINYIKRLFLLLPEDDQLAHRLRNLLAQEYARTGVPEKLTERRAQMEKKLREMPGSPEFVRRLESLEDLCQQRPDDIELRLQLVAHLREGGLVDRANSVLGPIIDGNPNHFGARLEQACLWRAENELVLATNLFETLLAEQPGDERLRQTYLDSRVTLLQQQAKENPSDKELQHHLMEAEHQRDLHRISVLKKQLRDHPDDHAGRVELGQLLLRSKQDNEAIAVLQRLLHEPSYAGQAFFILGACFRERGQLDLAADQYRKAISFFKDRGYSHVPSEELKEAYYFLGLCLEKQGKLETAREAYTHVYTTDINFRDIRERYEQTYRASSPNA
jgi:tetratricopeptide (TPR) repeat protein